MYGLTGFLTCSLPLPQAVPLSCSSVTFFCSPARCHSFSFTSDSVSHPLFIPSPDILVAFPQLSVTFSCYQRGSFASLPKGRCYLIQKLEFFV
ncbi:hypothetical protein L218DRAFT_202986 [Marasmius fiardii PR-910]|nr:hypothetical protein L218DRAFT_202986 [Marasmius fiardii PR-910]